ncbi:hypothetical protein N8J89_20985 [Crossiella sp. CA-258035]|nr:hypothetical protein [Crossiella sp. CA-258035]WHT15624.1 hypothetical protein N8J89_20985 [Crossiella sp. CA-258035]
MTRVPDLARLSVVLLSRQVEVPVHTHEMQRLLRQHRAGWTDLSPL